ncbi:MAG: Helix-turn-helix domain protein [Candidatus Aminicenantes bacterium ADurb.Bin508]|nr:MAG: Helix-turn-helix domain protein [Candidatus Aminicenantes bacterium ADurb.Bin508]
MDRLHQEFFNEHWEEICADEKTNTAPTNEWVYPTWNLYAEKPEPPLPSLPSAPTIRDSFNGVRFASSPFFVREGFRSICTPSFWKVSSTGQPYYTPPKEKRITYLIGRKEAGIVQVLPGEEAWRIVQTLGVKTGLLHIQFAAFCMESEKPWACFAQADGDALIKLLRLNEEKKLDPETGKRRRLSREEQLQELEGHLKSLRAIHVDVRSRPDRDGTIWKTDEPEPLWDVSIERRTQGTFEEAEELEMAIDLRINVRAGRWAMHESGKDTGLHYSYLSRSVLEFNPKTEDWAIKLGVFTSCFASYREHRFIVRTLLENLLNPEEIAGMEDPSGDKRKRNNTANKLESTLAAMEERGWTVERSPEYVAAMGDGEARRSRNFFPRLLESRLELTPPPVSGQKSLPKEKKALNNGTAFSGRAFREQRIKMGLSQKEAARELGRSQGMIAQIESGTRKLSAEDEKTWEKYRKRYYSKSRTTLD